MPYTRIFGDLRFYARSKHWAHLDNMVEKAYTAEDVKWMRTECKDMSVTDRYTFLNEQCFNSLLPKKTIIDEPIITVVTFLEYKGKTKEDHSIEIKDAMDLNTLIHEMVHSFMMYFPENEENEAGRYMVTGRYIGDVEVNNAMIEDLDIRYNGEVDTSSNRVDGETSYAAHNSLFYECLMNCFLLWGPGHIDYTQLKL